MNDQKKILVIDDADFILESTSTLLSFEGYEVFTAPDGLIGVQSAMDNHPDMILCDISMPGLDGYGVIDKIRSTPELATVPFVFLTAFTEKSNMRIGMEKGADDFLIKPYTRDELISAIDAQWNKKTRIDNKVQKQIEEVGRNVTYALPHEFRTVLNQVVGSAKYLLSTAGIIEEVEIKEISEDIISSSQRLLKIAENFLAYIKIESFATNAEARKQLRFFHTDEPAAVIMDILNHVSKRHSRFGDFIFEKFTDSVSIEISSDSFHKIISELVDNSFKFSEHGTKITLSSWLDGEHLYFSIKDCGRGMSQTQINNVGAYIQFERTIYEQQGVGLGLVIAKRLVELHDGEFKIKSQEGAGTEIIFFLPESKRENIK
ncbi:MAG: hypothetical protein HW421_1932 [Ignavibacteria bacterium]|nr:hypothetical protein [Ignavibacteria bacterium]